MPRNLDLTALRSFVAVADTGGVTRAAGFLNLTQSAVSMQIKRLEEALGLDLFDRTGRRVAITAAGDQLLSYARRMVAMNDEVWTKLTCKQFEGEVVLGVPHDIVYPTIPVVLQRFAAEFPRVRVELHSWSTRRLKTAFGLGELDVILTTEEVADEGAETLAQRPLVWVGAQDGRAWLRRPLPLAFGRNCIFRPLAEERLDAAGIEWITAVESDEDRTIEAAVSADLAVHALIEGTEPRHLAPIAHGGSLPDLGRTGIHLYASHHRSASVVDALTGTIRTAYAQF